MPRRYAVFLRLPAGIIICLGAAWLGAVAFESPHFGVLVGLVRDRILPRNEQAEASAAVRAAVSPVTVPDSSAGNVAAESPSAASAGKTTPEPVATSADHPGAASSRGSTPEPAPRPAADGPRLSAAEIAALVARGDAFLGVGDIASARLFFERAADSGDGRAAMRMAVTYDAVFLGRAGLHGVRGDQEQAALWYRRARELGDGKAEPPLGSLGTFGSAEPLR
jgi:TPR repeat protein